MATKIMDCDLAVIGAGGYGMVCAAKAADLLPGKKIIVIEKARKPGGATIFGHGPNNVYDSTWQRNAGAEPKSPQDPSGVFFDFLVSKGETEAKKYFKVGEIIFMGKMTQKIGIDMPGRIDKYKDLDDPSIGPGWWGSYLVDKMMECCKNMNVPVLSETRAKKFIKDSSGKITGIIADTKDGELQVNFRSCFIGAGGFGADYKKCQELWPKVYNNMPMHNLVPPSLTGDLIDAAREAGAGIDLKNAGCNTQGPYHHPYSYTVHIMAKTDAMVLQVNPEGVRVPTQGFSRPGQEFENPLVYSIGDQNILEKAAELAPDQISEPEDKARVKKWMEEIEEEAAVDENGRYGRHTTKANTLVELALKLGMDPNVLMATVEKYNRECEAGKGQGGLPQNSGQGGQGGGAGGMGAAPATSQIPVKKAPFYAIFLQPFRQCTHGGIIVNVNQEVLDAKGNVMPGLYAGGDCTTEYTLNTGSQTGGQGGQQGGQGGPQGGQGGSQGGQGGSQGGQGGQGSGGGGGGGMRSRAGIFGNYTAGTGGGMMGFYKGITAATNIAEYLKKA
jgi:succinate dehydrogenase/fumarate reductase flavoprotein subunit